MGTIPAPDIFRDTLDEYTRSTELNQAAQQLRQQQAVQQSQMATAEQQRQQSAAAFPIQQQSAQLQLEQQQREAQDEIRIRDAYKNSGGDLTKFQQNVQQAGVGPKAALGAVTMVNGMRKSVNDLSESDLALTKTKHEQFAPMLDEVVKADPKDQPGLWAKSIADAQQKGLITPQEAQEHGQYPGSDGAQLYANSLKTVDQLIKEREQNTKEQQANAGDWKEGGGGTLVNVNPKSPQFGKIVHGAGPVDQQELQSYLTAPTLKGEPLPPAQRNPATFLSWKAKQSPVAMVMGNQIGSGEALDQAAQRYSETGILPAGFSRSPGTTTAIIKRAAELNPSQNIAANSAAFKSNQTALTALQKNFENVSAFENTAGKNLDVFLKTAQKVVDSGSPWINSPLRTVDAKGLGSDDQAAFNAARVTAVTEIAKVLNSSNASGVLSDSARHEVEGLIGPDATMKQIVAAANVLKQDMTNRHDSYQDAITNLKKNMQSPTGAAPGGGGPSATQHKVGDTIVQGGQRFKATAVDANGKVTAADPL